MTLKQLLAQGRLKEHKTSKKEIADLFKIIKRDISDAEIKILSPDRRFSTAYNAVLQTATIVLYCHGYKPSGWGHHFTVFQAMKIILGKDYEELADYFDSCRVKRNITDYDRAGEISEKEVKELISEAKRFFKKIENWVERNYPSLK
ncbi:MAG: SAV_6107 family HEPN domain-containing protein [Candidatus Aminicenantia bacterium]